MAKTDPEQLRNAAKARAPRRPTIEHNVSSYFAGGTRAAYNTSNDHVIPRTRCTEDLAVRMAAYGDRNGLSLSETVRTLIQAGLDAEETHV